MIPIVYVAGPYRGSTNWIIAQNIREAEVIGIEVARCGAMPLIPHANTAHFHGELTDQFWLDGTLEMLARCDAIVLTGRWQQSQDAKAELNHARARNMPAFFAGESHGFEHLRKWVSAWINNRRTNAHRIY